MALEGTPCVVCGEPVRALATTTYCPRESEHAALLAKPKCPRCGSREIAPYDTIFGWGVFGYVPSDQTYCKSCDHVFAKE